LSTSWQVSEGARHKNKRAINGQNLPLLSGALMIILVGKQYINLSLVSSIDCQFHNEVPASTYFPGSPAQPRYIEKAEVYMFSGEVLTFEGLSADALLEAIEAYQRQIGASKETNGFI
jgi:hypothetical protein